MWWACWLIRRTLPPSPLPSAPPGDVVNNTITRELISLTRASLSWTAPPDNNAAITYAISLCLLQANSLISVCGVDSAQNFSTTEATIEIPNLVPNRWYEVIIVASNTAGNSDPSERFILKTATSGGWATVQLWSIIYVYGACGLPITVGGRSLDGLWWEGGG